MKKEINSLGEQQDRAVRQRAIVQRNPGGGGQVLDVLRPGVGMPAHRHGGRRRPAIIDVGLHYRGDVMLDVHGVPPNQPLLFDRGVNYFPLLLIFPPPFGRASPPPQLCGPMSASVGLRGRCAGRLAARRNQ